jgi:hypothetical protein
MDHVLIPLLGLLMAFQCWLHVASHASAAPRTGTTMTTKDAATALAKDRWTRGDIRRQDRAGDALAALPDAMEESGACPRPDAGARAGARAADLVRLRALDREEAGSAEAL